MSRIERAHQVRQRAGGDAHEVANRVHARRENQEPARADKFRQSADRVDLSKRAMNYASQQRGKYTQDSPAANDAPRMGASPQFSERTGVSFGGKG